MWILEALLLVLCLLQYGRAADVEDLSGWMGEVQSILRSDGEQEVIKFDPTSVTQLSWKPRAFLAKQFLTEFECNHLIQLATDKLQASMVADVKSGKSVVSEIRTSLGMFVRRGHDEVVSRIEDRIAAWTLLPKENGECLQILRYQHGQKYEPHFDYFLDNKNKALAGGHRIATVLMYLSDVIKGGETVFPSADQDDDDNTEGSLVKDDSWSECGKRGLGVKPKRGDALLFFNLHPSAQPDPSSLHAGCPVLEGEKWSATKWIHVEAFETGEEEEEEHKHNKKKKNTDVECVNEDDNCEEWASYGRKERGKKTDRQTEMRPPLRLLSVLSTHSSSFKPSLAVPFAGCRWIRSSFSENNQRTPLQRVEWGRRDRVRNHGKRGDVDYWLKFSTALPQMFRRGICGESDSVSSSYPMQSVRITCCGAVSDAFMEALMCFGAGSCSIEDAHLGAPQEQEIFSDGPVPWTSDKRQLWNESCITALFPAGEDVAEALAMAADSVGLTEVPQYEVVNTEEIDWVQQVQCQFKPIEVAKGLWIIPKWSTPPDPEALNVMLDPGLAFGTGEHPTTRLCLQWLQHAVRPGDQILDYGTGSGILSIAALKMGVDGAVGVDIDPMAITSAKYNASLNNIEPHMFQVLEASGDDNPLTLGKGKFDIVVANILLNSLVQLATCIVAYTKPRGLVGLSGILVDQVDRVQEVYSPFLEDITVSYDNGWACVTGRKKLLL